MSFLEELKDPGTHRGYEVLGYAHNPFPVRGQVWPEVYVPRPELLPLKQSLLAFLRGTGPGRVWALAGDTGVGKTNFLQHVVWDLDQASAEGVLRGTTYKYIPSQQVAPRMLAHEIVVAIGEARLCKLLEQLSALPEQMRGSDLYRFLDKVIKGRGKVDPKAATHFLMRWLGGQQTLAQERRSYDIQAKERMAPAVGVSYLRIIFDLLVEHRLLDRIVLLLDEFEDVQVLSGSSQADYLMALKGLVNAFNLDRLLLMIAGQEAAFATFGARIPSLGSRWELVRLLSVGNAEQAVALADEYKRVAHERFLSSHSTAKRLVHLEPDAVVVKSIFADLLPSSGRAVAVAQRGLLNQLHDWVEERARRGA